MSWICAWFLFVSFLFGKFDDEISFLLEIVCDEMRIIFMNNELLFTLQFDFSLPIYFS